jgi:NADPH-dependent glutamate synthase beta subunit-like oxidoreductase/ferredoxin
MVEIKIDGISLKVPRETTVIEAARLAGIGIPSMCYKNGHQNHPSCMICLVKDIKSGNLFPSCAMRVSGNMEISTRDEDVINARKDALELLMSDHVGDCEAPCRMACPAFMDIPLMNRLIAGGGFAKALEIVKQEIALPFILGYICPAPCEKVCRRAQVDEAVSICQLKKFTAAKDAGNETAFLPSKKAKTGKRVAIVGSGPAGLSCAFYLLRHGHECVLFDKNEKAGGTLRYAVLDKELPVSVLDHEIGLIQSYGAEFRLNFSITKEFFEQEIIAKFDAIVLATGIASPEQADIFGISFSKSGIEVKTGTFETSRDWVFACGSSVKSLKMAVTSVAQGKATAQAVNEFLKGTISKPQPFFNSKFGKLQPAEVSEYLKESSAGLRILPFAGESNGFSSAEAISEAKRCLHCDCRKPASCKLRQYSAEYEIDRRKYSSGERKLLEKHFQHETVVYEPEKCIKCGLCVDITTGKKELTGLTFIGRGFNLKIDIPFNQTLKEALTKTAAECVEACPTGALSFKVGEEKS